MNPPSSKLRTPICTRERGLLVCDIAERIGELEGPANKRRGKKGEFYLFTFDFLTPLSGNGQK